MFYANLKTLFYLFIYLFVPPCCDMFFVCTSYWSHFTQIQYFYIFIIKIPSNEIRANPKNSPIFPLKSLQKQIVIDCHFEFSSGAIIRDETVSTGSTRPHQKRQTLYFERKLRHPQGHKRTWIHSNLHVRGSTRYDR